MQEKAPNLGGGPEDIADSGGILDGQENHHILREVEDVHAAVSKCEEEGGKEMVEPTYMKEMDYWFASCLDSQGRMIIFIQSSG